MTENDWEWLRMIENEKKVNENGLCTSMTEDDWRSLMTSGGCQGYEYEWWESDRSMDGWMYVWLRIEEWLESWRESEDWRMRDEWLESWRESEDWRMIEDLWWV